MLQKKQNSIVYKDVKIDNLNFEDVLKVIRLNINKKAHICATDVGNVIAAQKDAELKKAINQSLVSLADGKPLEWYGKLIGKSRVERITGFRLLKYLLEKEKDLKHFLLGDTKETQEKVVRKAKKINKQLLINCYSPPFKKKFDDEDNRIMIKKINKANPDIVWVSFGSKKQEKWILHNIGALNRGIMIAVGAAFKYYIGDLKIPSAKMQQLGMQWTTRLYDNPKRFLTNGPLIQRIQFIGYLPYEIIKNRKLLKTHSV